MAITDIDAALASSLFSNFNKKISSVKTQSKTISTKYGTLQTRIASTDALEFTPPAVLTDTANSALDKSFRSSAWLQAGDAVKKIQTAQDKCSFFAEMGMANVIEELRSGVIDKALSEAGSAISDAIGSTGFSMPEFGFGTDLSDIVNKGRAAYEAVEQEFSGIVGSVLETGKGAYARALELADQVGGAVSEGKKMIEKGLSTLAEPLRDLDELINCANAIGGADVVAQTDQMIDALNEVYDLAGVKDDPNQPDFGEFDDDKFFSDIGGITPDQQNNILTTTNMYDKSKNNASLAVDKAKGLADDQTEERSESSLASADSDTIEDKKSEITDRAEVVFDKPAAPPKPVAPGSPPKAAEPAEETQAPVTDSPYTIPGITFVTKQAPPPPTGIVYFSLIKRVDPWDEGSMTDYLSWDPNKTGYPKIRNEIGQLISRYARTQIENPTGIDIYFQVPYLQWRTQAGDDYDDGSASKETIYTVTAIVWILKEGDTPDTASNSIIISKEKQDIYGGMDNLDDYQPPDAKRLQWAASYSTARTIRVAKSLNKVNYDDLDQIITP
jgi:hypothetical protein